MLHHKWFHALCIALCATLLVVSLAKAAAPDERTPLLVIRFNHAHVSYERALKQAVEAAQSAKPDMSYEVVSYAPHGKAAHLKEVTEGITKLGVSASKVHASTKSASGTEEVRIYVQ
jgi:hypothetical protein